MSTTEGPLTDVIAGARPNFMKIAPIIAAIEQRRAAGSPLRVRLVHTGQHCDQRTSGDFFDQLGIPPPDVNLESGSGTAAEQTAAIMTRYDALLLAGGVTEETTVMGGPCMTLRDTTERPETVTEGTNELLGTDPAALQPALDRLFAGQWKHGRTPALWDGRTGERIAERLEALLCP